MIVIVIKIINDDDKDNDSDKDNDKDNNNGNDKKVMTTTTDNDDCDTVKTRIKEHVLWGFRLMFFLYIGCFLQNQPENVLKVFLKLLLKIKYCTYYQQKKSMSKHNILIN